MGNVPPSEPARGGSEGKRATGNKGRPRNAKGQYCGGKGQLCDLMDCPTCFIWLTVNEDGTMSVDEGARDVMTKKQKEEWDAKNKALRVMKDADADEGAMDTMRCAMACVFEAIMMAAGRSDEPAAWKKIRKFVKIDEKSGDITIASNLLSTLSEDQLCPVRSYRAYLEMCSEGCDDDDDDCDPKEMEEFAEMVKHVIYLTLYSAAKENRFDLDRDPTWDEKRSRSRGESERQETAKKGKGKRKRGGKGKKGKGK